MGFGLVRALQTLQDIWKVLEGSGHLVSVGTYGEHLGIKVHNEKRIKEVKLNNTKKNNETFVIKVG